MTKILLVGLGKMGGALLSGWSKNPSIIVSSLDPQNNDADYQSTSEINAAFDIILLAVKPQVMKEVAEGLKHLATPDTLILSIAAGINISFYESIFGTGQPVIRVMPNTPALIGKGMSVLCGNAFITPAQKQTAIDLLAAVGMADWIDDENLMDAVTAVSGSGPAYVFYLIETMTEAGVKAGLPPALAERLARQTVIGAATLADVDKDTPATTLRQNVTSKGGTTEAALTVLMVEDGLSPIMTRAINAATQRGKELSQ